MLLTLTISLCALTTIVLLSRLLRLRAARLPLPPGPTGWPLIGNLLEIPPTNIWKYYGTEMLQKYGEPLKHHSIDGNNPLLTTDVGL